MLSTETYSSPPNLRMSHDDAAEASAADPISMSQTAINRPAQPEQTFNTDSICGIATRENHRAQAGTYPRPCPMANGFRGQNTKIRTGSTPWKNPRNFPKFVLE